MYTAYRPCSDDYLADAALMRHMRELALQAAPEGVARIGHGAHVRKALRDLHAALASTRAEDRSPSLQKAAEAAGFFEPAAGQLGRRHHSDHHSPVCHHTGIQPRQYLVPGGL